MIIVAIIVVLLVLSFLVIIHEAGHFIVARRNGITVREFGIGFPPRIAGWRFGRSKTIYSLNALPIGGFVSLKGENGEEKGRDSYATQSAGVKTRVLLAGVTINIVFAYVVMTLLLGFGVANIFPFSLPSNGWLKPFPSTAARVRIVDISPGSAADKAHLQLGDNIEAINNQTVTSDTQLRSLTKALAGRPASVRYDRNGTTQTAQVTLGTSADKGYLGVATEDESLLRYRWTAAPIVGVIATAKLAWATLVAFGSFVAGLFTRLHVSQEVAGPIGITAALPRVAKFGWSYFWLLIAQISLSLGIVNALPIAPLDGGKALFVWLRGAGLKVTKRFETGLQIAGLAFLLILIIVVSVNDVLRLR